MTTNFVPTGIGLGMRSRFAARLARGEGVGRIDFIEVAPENHMERGGRWPHYLHQARDHHPVITHGLTMSLGGEAPLDAHYLQEVTELCATLGTPWHSDHLCFAADGDARLHDLLPIPFTRRGVKRVAERIKHARSALGREMLIENISQYLLMGEAEMDEAEFIQRGRRRGRLWIAARRQQRLRQRAELWLRPLQLAREDRPRAGAATPRSRTRALGQVRDARRHPRRRRPGSGHRHDEVGGRTQGPRSRYCSSATATSPPSKSCSPKRTSCARPTNPR